MDQGAKDAHCTGHGRTFNVPADSICIRTTVKKNANQKIPEQGHSYKVPNPFIKSLKAYVQFAPPIIYIYIRDFTDENIPS